MFRHGGEAILQLNFMNNHIIPENLWEQMLRKKHLLKFDYGFTIPFIIGAYHKQGFLTDEDLATSTCIRHVLMKVLETATEAEPIKIFDCPDLGNEPVLQYLSAGLTAKEAEEQKSNLTNVERKIYWNLYHTEITDMNSLIDYLWNRKSKLSGEMYSQIISEHRFSCHKGQWKPFDNDENRFIVNITTL